jgi:hypothetical protein
MQSMWVLSIPTPGPTIGLRENWDFAQSANFPQSANFCITRCIFDRRENPNGKNFNPSTDAFILPAGKIDTFRGRRPVSDAYEAASRTAAC